MRSFRDGAGKAPTNDKDGETKLGGQCTGTKLSPGQAEEWWAGLEGSRRETGDIALFQEQWLLNHR